MFSTTKCPSFIRVFNLRLQLIWSLFLSPLDDGPSYNQYLQEVLFHKCYESSSPSRGSQKQNVFYMRERRSTYVSTRFQLTRSFIVFKIPPRHIIPPQLDLKIPLEFFSKQFSSKKDFPFIVLDGMPLHPKAFRPFKILFATFPSENNKQDLSFPQKLLHSFAKLNPCKIVKEDFFCGGFFGQLLNLF